ncbi:MAG: hypothetical protein WD739_09165 [Actinomycetota bacterium]
MAVDATRLVTNEDADVIRAQCRGDEYALNRVPDAITLTLLDTRDEQTRVIERLLEVDRAHGGIEGAGEGCECATCDAYRLLARLRGES